MEGMVRDILQCQILCCACLIHSVRRLRDKVGLSLQDMGIGMLHR